MNENWFIYTIDKRKTNNNIFNEKKNDEKLFIYRQKRETVLSKFLKCTVWGFLYRTMFTHSHTPNGNETFSMKTNENRSFHLVYQQTHTHLHTQTLSLIPISCDKLITNRRKFVAIINCIAKMHFLVPKLDCHVGNLDK